MAITHTFRDRRESFIIQITHLSVVEDVTCSFAQKPNLWKLSLMENYESRFNESYSPCSFLAMLGAVPEARAFARRANRAARCAAVFHARSTFVSCD